MERVGLARPSTSHDPRNFTTILVLPSREQIVRDALKQPSHPRRYLRSAEELRIPVLSQRVMEEGDSTAGSSSVSESKAAGSESVSQTENTASASTAGGSASSNSALAEVKPSAVASVSASGNEQLSCTNAVSMSTIAQSSSQPKTESTVPAAVPISSVGATSPSVQTTTLPGVSSVGQDQTAWNYPAASAVHPASIPKGEIVVRATVQTEGTGSSAMTLPQHSTDSGGVSQKEPLSKPYQLRETSMMTDFGKVVYTNVR